MSKAISIIWRSISYDAVMFAIIIDRSAEDNKSPTPLIPTPYRPEISNSITCPSSMENTEQASDKLWLDVEAVTRRFFDNELSPETAAQKLATIVLPSPPPDQDDDDDEDCTMAHIEGMWRHIIGMLEVTPERAQTACDLIVCMSQLPPVLTISGRQLCEENQCAWQDVPRLGWALRDEWSSKSA